jgi:hypothetical protein
MCIEYVPGAHATQLLGEFPPRLGFAFPLAQDRHTEEDAAFTVVLYVPAGHNVQLDEPREE